MSEAAYPLTLSVLGTSQNSGKTVTCIGLLCKLLAPPYNLKLADVGYMKPVGQRAAVVPAPDGSSIVAERDALLVTALMGVNRPRYDLLSPILWLAGRTSACIDDACCRGAARMRSAHIEAVQNAYRALAKGKRAMIIEGTGQIGVGSVGGISAADTVMALRALGAPVRVLLVTAGDPARSIDETVPHLLALAQFGVCVDGLIVNRVDPDRLAQAANILKTYYGCLLPSLYGQVCGTDGCIPILGLVPEMPDLALPTIRLLRDHFAGKADANLRTHAWPHHPEPERVLVRRTVALSLRDRYLPLLRDGDLVVAGINANRRIVSLLDHQRSLRHTGQTGLAGIILSCQAVGGLLPRTRAYLARAETPVLAVDLDTATVVEEIAGLNVKIQSYDLAKRDLIAGAYCQHVDDLPGDIPKAEPLQLSKDGATVEWVVPPCSCPVCRKLAE